MAIPKPRCCSSGGGVRIRRHDEAKAAMASLALPARLHVEALGISVHLDRHPRLGGGVQHLLHPAGDRRPAQDVASERVRPRP